MVDFSPPASANRFAGWLEMTIFTTYAKTPPMSLRGGIPRVLGTGSAIL